MAITKIMHMKEAKKGVKSTHLKNSIEYILNPNKCRDGFLTGSLNCQVESAYEDFLNTKQFYEKEDGRQGYHIALSFKEGEVTPELALEITKRFAEEYLGNRFETIYAVHEDTLHLHGHIIWNSVSYSDGLKYYYKKGDWKKFIQPITNKLCEEYNLSTIDLENELTERNKTYNEWEANKKKEMTIPDIVRSDIDKYIETSNSLDEFILKMEQEGYKVRNGKYLSIKPPGRRAVRTYQLGEDYKKDNIVLRINKETKKILEQRKIERKELPNVMHVRRRYKTYKSLTQYEKKYFHFLYSIHAIKKGRRRSWATKEQLLSYKKIQEEFLYITKNNIKQNNLLQRKSELEEQKEYLTQQRKECYRVKRALSEEEHENIIYQIKNQLDYIKHELARIRKEEVILSRIINRDINLDNKKITKKQKERGSR